MLAKLGFGLAVLFLNLNVQALTQSTDYSIHQGYISVRAIGMGNAFTAVVDDTSAFYYNPAALARMKDHELKMSLGAGGDTKVLGLYNGVNNAVNTPGGTAAQTSAVDSLLNSNMGNYYSIRAPTVGAFYMWPGWEVAFVPADVSMDMQIHQSAGASLNVNGYNDSELALSYGHDLDWFKGHELSWGMTLKTVNRIYAGADIQAADLVQGTQIFDPSLAHEGLTFDADFGTLWTPPVPQHGLFSFLKYMKPTFAIVGRNLLDYGFKTDLHLLKNDSPNPPPLGRRMDIGSKWELPHWWVFDSKFAFDERDIGDPNYTFRKGMHAGAEFYWTMYHWWRGHWSIGLNQGYLSAGVGAKFTVFEFDLATYGEDVGTDAVPLESRRYMAELAMDF